MAMPGLRFQVFNALKIMNNKIVDGSECSSRLSIYVPSKNALLLMRCRFDLLKMKALANGLWDSTRVIRGGKRL